MQWGTIAWKSFSNAFYGCSNLKVSATDSPDLSNVDSMVKMFYSTSSFDQDLGSWQLKDSANLADAFVGSALSDANYSSMLIAWDSGATVSTHVTLGSEAHCDSPGATDAKDDLINNYGWTISDGDTL